ncbi:MAG: VOC family protein [Rhodocyclaceae bacterium]
MKPVISMITLGVADLARATRFYEEGLGLPRYPFDSDGVVFFELAGAWLSLYPRTDLAADAQVDAEGHGFRGITLAHNVDSPAAVDAVLAQAVEAGAQRVKPAEKVFWGGYSGYFADPDGHLWEVAHNPFTHIGP